MASPYNGLFVQSNTTPGTEPTVTNADGSTINSGGKAGTLATATLTGNSHPSSFTVPPAITELNSSNNLPAPANRVPL